jgi:hypothetical protein
MKWRIGRAGIVVNGRDSCEGLAGRQSGLDEPATSRDETHFPVVEVRYALPTVSPIYLPVGGLGRRQLVRPVRRE